MSSKIHLQSPVAKESIRFKFNYIVVLTLVVLIPVGINIYDFEVFDNTIKNTLKTIQSIELNQGDVHKSKKETESIFSTIHFNHHDINDNKNFTISTVTKPALRTQTNWTEKDTFFMIHVGKAGGSSINSNIRSLILRKPKRMRERLIKRLTKSKSEMIISNHTIGYIHDRLWNPKDSMKRSSTFLWAIRDPFDRIASAFYMQHPENSINNCKRMEMRKDTGFSFLFYCQCFLHVDNFVSSLQQNASEILQVNKITNETFACSQLAKVIINPQGKSIINNTPCSTYGHIAMNYGHFYHQTSARFPRKDIVSIRTEYLWDDLQHLEHLLGGNANVTKNTKLTQTHGSEHFRLKKELTDPSMLQVLCCAIEQEVKLYSELLKRAINIKEWQKRESLEALSKRCNLDMCNNKGQ